MHRRARAGTPLCTPSADECGWPAGVDNSPATCGRCGTLCGGVIVNVEQHRPARIDMSRRYTLSAGTRVFPRSANSVQIGTEAPRCVVVMDAPGDSIPILDGLDGAATVSQVLAAHHADPLVWSSLLGQLADAQLLIPVEQLDRSHIPAVPGAHLSDERSGLAHRYGHVAAVRILQTRDDALVVVRGDSTIAAGIATGLAAAGIGHIHHEPGTTNRPPPGTPAGQRRGPGARRGSHLSARLREAYPTVRVHRPAAHQHPTMVVMTGDAVPDLSLAASFVRSHVPHLAVTAGVARTVVGPLVLPGRSSCLSCAHRHRTDADPEWPVVARQLADDPPRVSAFLAAAAACLAVGEALEHIDGIGKPRTVDGTLEWWSGDLAPRRRSWAAHPECGCRTAAG